MPPCAPSCFVEAFEEAPLEVPYRHDEVERLRHLQALLEGVIERRRRIERENQRMLRPRRWSFKSLYRRLFVLELLLTCVFFACNPRRCISNAVSRGLRTILDDWNELTESLTGYLAYFLQAIVISTGTQNWIVDSGDVLVVAVEAAVIISAVAQVVLIFALEFRRKLSLFNAMLFLVLLKLILITLCVLTAINIKRQELTQSQTPSENNMQ